jgi:hypothetical protein
MGAQVAMGGVMEKNEWRLFDIDFWAEISL